MEPVLAGHVSGADGALNRVSRRGAAEAEPSRNGGEACATAGPRGIDRRRASSYDHAAWALLFAGSLAPQIESRSSRPGAVRPSLELASYRSRQPAPPAKKLVRPIDMRTCICDNLARVYEIVSINT